MANQSSGSKGYVGRFDGTQAGVLFQKILQIRRLLLLLLLVVCWFCCVVIIIVFVLFPRACR